MDTSEAGTRENIVACLSQAGDIHPAEVIAEEDCDLTCTVEDNTGDLRAVQSLAGHASPETTAGYTRATRARLVAAVTAIEYA